MRKRVLSLLTTLALMAGLCTPLGGLVPEAEAAGYKTYGVLEYGTVTSTGKPGERDPNGLYQVIEACDPNATGAIVIPSEIDGLPVKEIDSYAFDGCSGITSVYVPGSVELIGQRAFRDCTSLESVTLCDGLLRIRGYAFEGCTSLTSIVIPSTVESLWSDSLSTTRGHTFLDCTSLREVFILSRNVALESSYALNSMYTPYYSDLFENCAEDLVIYGYAGSTAEEYAGYSWYNLAFSVLDESFEWTPDLPEEENQPTGAIPIPILNDPTCTEEGVSLSWTLPLEVPGETQTVDGFCILRKTAGGSYQPIDQVSPQVPLTAVRSWIRFRRTQSFPISPMWRMQMNSSRWRTCSSISRMSSPSSRNTAGTLRDSRSWWTAFRREGTLCLYSTWKTATSTPSVCTTIQKTPTFTISGSMTHP